MLRHTHRGFTLIELMIVVSILGILVAIAIPKFTSLVSKSRESTTKGNLGAIRSALSIYYSDAENFYPVDNLSSLLVGSRFLPLMPVVQLPTTPNNVGHPLGITGVATGLFPAGLTDVADGTSGWLYDNVNGDTNWGRVVVNCAHQDAYGSPWTEY